jgi:RNA polymerase sigma-70 factor (ECF subfamily)
VSGWQLLVERLIAERGSRLAAYAGMLVSRGDDAEDLVHDAIVKTFSRRRTITDLDHAEAYVRRVMPTLVIDRARSRSARQRTTQRAFERERIPADLDAGLDVRRALQELAPRERACIVLRFFDDFTVPQIAAHLDLAEGTVKRYLADASARLASLLAVEIDSRETVRVEAVPGEELR